MVVPAILDVAADDLDGKSGRNTSDERLAENPVDAGTRSIRWPKFGGGVWVS
jgi:hypothetical protein